MSLNRVGFALLDTLAHTSSHDFIVKPSTVTEKPHVSSFVALGNASSPCGMVVQTIVTARAGTAITLGQCDRFPWRWGAIGIWVADEEVEEEDEEEEEEEEEEEVEEVGEDDDAAALSTKPTIER